VSDTGIDDTMDDLELLTAERFWLRVDRLPLTSIHCGKVHAGLKFNPTRCRGFSRYAKKKRGLAFMVKMSNHFISFMYNELTRRPGSGAKKWPLSLAMYQK